jgi:hypothetical protein
MTEAVLLRSRVMGNCQARFWRAVEGAIPSLTLIGWWRRRELFCARTGGWESSGRA